MPDGDVNNLFLYWVKPDGTIVPAEVVEVKYDAQTNEYIITVDHCSEYVITSGELTSISEPVPTPTPDGGSSGGSTGGGSSETPAPSAAPTATPAPVRPAIPRSRTIRPVTIPRTTCTAPSR